MIYGATGGGGRLPAEYQEVEYIQSSGTQYIDTGYAPSSDSKVEFRLSGLNVTNSNQYVFGEMASWLNDAFGVTITSVWTAGKTTYVIYNTDLLTANGDVADGGVHTGELSSGGLYIDGTLAVSTSGTFSGSTNLSIFAVNVNNTVSEFGSFKLHTFKIYDNSTIERDLAPCYRKQDGEIGMYDLVNDVFYTNSGSGIFTKGPDVN